MTQETDALRQEIKGQKEKIADTSNPMKGSVGYNTTLYILTDLFGCILIGLALGVFLQTLFNTSVLLTAVLTMLGGVAGFWTVIRYVRNLEKKQDAFLKRYPPAQKPIPKKFDDEEGYLS